MIGCARGRRNIMRFVRAGSRDKICGDRISVMITPLKDEFFIISSISRWPRHTESRLSRVSFTTTALYMQLSHALTVIHGHSTTYPHRPLTRHYGLMLTRVTPLSPLLRLPHELMTNYVASNLGQPNKAASYLCSPALPHIRGFKRTQ